MLSKPQSSHTPQLDLHHNALVLTASDSFLADIYTPTVVSPTVRDVGEGPLISAPSAKDYRPCADQVYSSAQRLATHRPSLHLRPRKRLACAPSSASARLRLHF